MERYFVRSARYSVHERKTKKGKVYDVHFRIFTMDGVARQKKLSGFATKTAAKEAYTAFLQNFCEIMPFNRVLSAKKTPSESPTVEELYFLYMKTLENVNKESVIYDKRNMFRLYILPTLGKEKITELTRETLYRWQDTLWTMKNPRTGSAFTYRYLTKIRGFLSAFLAWCETRYGFKNELKNVEKPRRTGGKSGMSFWTREEFEKFIAVVDNDLYRALFTFMFFTGLRKGEVFALSPSDVFPDKIRVNKSVNRRTFGKDTYAITTTKAGKDATIPVCGVVQKLIREYKPLPGAFYFGGNAPLAATTVSRYFDKYIARAGVKKIRIHDLRHSFVSMLIHMGANFTVIADLITDTVEQVTKTYGHLYEEDKLSVLARIT